MTSLPGDTPIAPEPTPREASHARVVAVRGGRVEVREDRLSGEEPLAIRACGPGQDPVDVAVTMRTPGHEDELAAGFLRTEGLIDDARGDRRDHAWRSVDPCPARRRDHRPPRPRVRRVAGGGAALRRHGLVRHLRQGVARRGRGPVRPDPGRPRRRAVDPALAAGAPARGAGRVRGDRRAPRRRACSTRPARCSCSARTSAATTRSTSWSAASSWPGRCRSTTGSSLVSGRASFELVQKAAVAGVPILAAVSAPSDLAVEAAERLGVTLVGFLRGDGFNVYAHPERDRARRQPQSGAACPSGAPGRTRSRTGPSRTGGPR